MKDYLNQLLFDAVRRFVPFKDWIGELKTRKCCGALTRKYPVLNKGIFM